MRGPVFCLVLPISHPQFGPDVKVSRSGWLSCGRPPLTPISSEERTFTNSDFLLFFPLVFFEDWVPFLRRPFFAGLLRWVVSTGFCWTFPSQTRALFLYDFRELWKTSLLLLKVRAILLYLLSSLCFSLIAPS